MSLSMSLLQNYVLRAVALLLFTICFTRICFVAASGAGSSRENRSHHRDVEYKGIEAAAQAKYEDRAGKLIAGLKEKQQALNNFQLEKKQLFNIMKRLKDRGIRRDQHEAFAKAYARVEHIDAMDHSIRRQQVEHANLHDTLLVSQSATKIRPITNKHNLLSMVSRHHEPCVVNKDVVALVKECKDLLKKHTGQCVRNCPFR